MSLINEALKKAQRVRTEDATDAVPPMPGDNGATGGVRIAKRKQARSTQTTILLGAGAIVLVVLSVVITVFFINRPKPETSAPAVAKAAPVVPQAEGTPPPTVTAPVITPPVVTPPPLAAAPVPATPAAPTLAAPAATVPPTETAAAPAPLAAAKLPPTETLAPTTEPARPAETSPASGKADERVMAFVDSIRVTGIRSSGDGSRVLMNERVYRVNEIVERTLGVRLVKVSSDSLTFADANGVTYVKFF
jgi:hypothetical protein